MSEQPNKPEDPAKEITPWQAWGNGVSTIGPNPLPDGPPVDLDLRPRNPEQVINAIAGRDPNSVRPQRGLETMSHPDRPTHTFEDGQESPAEAPEGDEPAPEPQEEPEEDQETPEGGTRPAPAN